MRSETDWLRGLVLLVVVGGTFIVLICADGIAQNMNVSVDWGMAALALLFGVIYWLDTSD